MISSVVFGNLGKDAEVSLGDVPRVKFSLASNSRAGGDDRTTWVNCTAFGKRFVAVADHMRKGGQIVARGRLEQIDGRDGSSFLSLVVDDLQLAGKRGDT